MTKYFVFLILTASIFSCQSKLQTEYASELKNCLTDKDVAVLNRATFEFEQQLANHYNSTNHNKNFHSFLEDMSSINGSLPNFKSDFFLNQKSSAVIKELKETGTFEKIWKMYVEEKDDDYDIPITNLNALPEYEEPEKPKLELYVLNNEGDYLRCVNWTSQNEHVKEFLNSLSKYGDIAPSMVAGALSQEMNSEDFDDQLNKVIVAIGLYYDIVKILTENPL